MHFFREVKRRGQQIYLLRILKMWHGERGNWSKILFRMLWQRRREKQKFRSFITFSTSSTYTGFSLCDTFWPKILHHLTHFQDSFVFILPFLFPYADKFRISCNEFFPNFMPFPRSRRMTLRSLRTSHSQNSDTGIRDLHCQERLETRVPAIYLTSCFHDWLIMVQC